MKKVIFLLTVLLSFGLGAGSEASAARKAASSQMQKLKLKKKWRAYDPGEVFFRDNAPQTEGSKIYSRIIPEPAPYIRENALLVLQTLYRGPKDPNVPKLKRIYYSLDDYNGVSEKYGHGDHVGIRYSTRWIERSFAGGDTARLDYETRGVLYHELTHAYQLEPKNCGQYTDGGEYWCFIEGMADAVRVACGCFEQDFQSKDRPRAETWRKGYRVAGYFLYWIQLNKDKDFLRKFNRSAAELETWSWDAAMRHVLGDRPENGVEALWTEYRRAIGEVE